jgi:hypothetical protein
MFKDFYHPEVRKRLKYSTPTSDVDEDVLIAP